MPVDTITDFQHTDTSRSADIHTVNKLPNVKQDTVSTLYKNRLANLSYTNSIVESNILGSFGRGDATPESDMDVWVVLNKIPDIYQLSQMAKEELSVRQTIGNEMSIPTLSRHMATFLTEEEAQLYRSTFPTRVGVPYALGEHRQLIGQRVHDYKSNPLDLCVSLDEFRDNYRQTGNRKWLRRIFIESHYYKTGQRLKTIEDVEKYLGENHISEERILSLAEEITKPFKENADPHEIRRRTLAHTLMWTLEKVRWEMVFALSQEGHFDRWRQGQERRIGFYPREIGNLMKQVIEELDVIPDSSQELGMALIKATREFCTTSTVSDIHQYLTAWINDSTKKLLGTSNLNATPIEHFVVPTKTSGTDTITRIAENKGRRCLISEALAWDQINPGVIVGMTGDNNACSLSVRDFHGHPISDDELEINVDKYARIVREIHATPIDMFGRLGASAEAFSYKTYLMQKLADTDVPDSMRKRLQNLVHFFSDELDTVQSVLCHMDPGPSNVIVNGEGKLMLVNFTHASGNAREWDIERICLQLPPHLRDSFRRAYDLNSELPQNTVVNLVTRAVMLTAFTNQLADDEAVMRRQREYEINQTMSQLEALQQFVRISTVQKEHGIVGHASPLAMEI